MLYKFTCQSVRGAAVHCPIRSNYHHSWHNSDPGPVDLGLAQDCMMPHRHCSRYISAETHGQSSPLLHPQRPAVDPAKA